MMKKRHYGHRWMNTYSSLNFKCRYMDVFLLSNNRKGLPLHPIWAYVYGVQTNYCVSTTKVYLTSYGCVPVISEADIYGFGTPLFPIKFDNIWNFIVDKRKGFNTEGRNFVVMSRWRFSFQSATFWDSNWHSTWVRNWFVRCVDRWIKLEQLLCCGSQLFI